VSVTSILQNAIGKVYKVTSN